MHNLHGYLGGLIVPHLVVGDVDQRVVTAGVTGEALASLARLEFSCLERTYGALQGHLGSAVHVHPGVLVCNLYSYLGLLPVPLSVVSRRESLLAGGGLGDL